jgi:hypothetical protein
MRLEPVGQTKKKGLLGLSCTELVRLLFSVIRTLLEKSRIRISPSSSRSLEEEESWPDLACAQQEFFHFLDHIS